MTEELLKKGTLAKEAAFKLATITTEQKNRLIYKETIRIMELNGYELDENKWFSDPMLHPNVKIKLTEKDDIAA